MTNDSKDGLIVWVPVTPEQEKRGLIGTRKFTLVEGRPVMTERLVNEAAFNLVNGAAKQYAWDDTNRPICRRDDEVTDVDLGGRYFRKLVAHWSGDCGPWTFSHSALLSYNGRREIDATSTFDH